MAYKPPTVSRTSLAGKAKVQLGKVNGKNVVGVTFEDNQDVTYTIAQKDAPKSVTKGIFYVKLSSDKTKIESMSPQNGTFTVKVQSFPAKEGEEPAPKIVHNQKFNSSQEVFDVILEVVAPKYEGMTIFLRLPYYYFAGADEEVNGTMRNVLALVEPKKSNQKFKLVRNFLTASGVWDKGALPYEDNVLPRLQKVILRADKKFDVLLEDGWVQAVVLDDDEEFGEPSAAPTGWADEGETTETVVATTSPSTEPTTNWGTPEEAEEFEEPSDEGESDAPWNDV